MFSRHIDGETTQSDYDPMPAVFLWESCRRRQRRGFFLKQTLSVTASPCHLPRRGEALALWESCRRRQRRGFFLKQTLSVTASPCHLPRRGEALAEAYSLGCTGQLLLSFTNEDETCRFCQGLALRESCRRRRLRGFVPEETPSVISLCEMPPPPKVVALAGA